MVAAGGTARARWRRDRCRGEVLCHSSGVLCSVVPQRTVEGLLRPRRELFLLLRSAHPHARGVDPGGGVLGVVSCGAEGGHVEPEGELTLR